MLKGKTVILGVTGSIAAYKAVDIASQLTQAGARVDVIMTEAATEFVTPLTFQAITGRAVTSDMFELPSDFSIDHISLAEAADVIVIAPATANIIAKLAAGMADDILCCTVLASKSPVLIAPAMDTNMFENPITQDNLSNLKARNFITVGPASGRLASGKEGLGRLADINDITGTICQVLGRGGDLAHKNIVVTAGGTQEPIDPVRCITNRSLGKMGYALAEAARDRGARVTLITAPASLAMPVGIEIVNVGTAQEMYQAVRDVALQADVLIMAAAVADYRPVSAAKDKIKKKGVGLTLELEPTPDILGSVQGDFIKVGFAAESSNLVENAKQKLQQKGLDLIVANDISSFGADSSQVTLIDRDGKVENLPLLTKREVADKILDKVVDLLAKKTIKPEDIVEIPIKKGHIDRAYLFIPAPQFRKGLLPSAGSIQLVTEANIFDATIYVFPSRKEHATIELHNGEKFREWYERLGIVAGDKAAIKVIEPMTKYHLEILKKRKT